jgi:hypothetical protein
MPTLKGETTRTLFLKTESHKLHEEFEVRAANTVKPGQLLALHTDGTVYPAAAGANESVVIGYALQPAAAGELVTVSCRGYGIAFGYAHGAGITAGPVKAAAAAVNADGYSGYANIGGAEQALTVGWAIDSGAQNSVVRILFKS